MRRREVGPRLLEGAGHALCDHLDAGEDRMAFVEVVCRVGIPSQFSARSPPIEQHLCAMRVACRPRRAGA
jgi:hypothetical protein